MSLAIEPFTIAVPESELGFPIISYHEQLLGCHKFIQAARTPDQMVRGYEMLEDLRNYRDILQTEESRALSPLSAWRRLRNPRIAFTLAASLIGLVAFSVWFFARQSRVRWAREQACRGSSGCR